jgi:hypothetical protein
MLIFYGEAEGRSNIDSEKPVDEAPSTVLQIFRTLDSRRGFLGIVLEPRFVLQLMPENRGNTHIEVLDCSQPEFDSCIVANDFAEKLIEMAGKGEDVFRYARKTIHDWDRTTLPPNP